MSSKVFRSLHAQAAALLCLCVFLISVNAQSTNQSSYSQPIRTFHSPEEFKRLTKGQVKIHRQNSLPSQKLFGADKGIIQRYGQRTFRPFPAKSQLP